MTSITQDQDAIKQIIKYASKNCKSLEDISSFIKDLTGPIIEEMLKGELDHHLGYEKYGIDGKNSGNSRNGYYEKKIRTTAGESTINIPRDRNGEFEPMVISKYQSNTNEIEEKIINMYGLGLSTRDIAGHVKDIYGADISADMVSTITDKIMPKVEERKTRPLDACYPIIFLDAIHCKVKENEIYVNKAVYMVVGYSISGYKDVLGFYIGEEETSKFWQVVCADLYNRGVKDICIACVDGLNGFSKAIKSVFGEKVEIQRCVVHQIRNSFAFVSHNHIKEFKQDLAKIYKAPNLNSAEKHLKEFSDRWGNIYSNVVKSWNENRSELSVYFIYTDQIRKMIYTTNIIESNNAKIRKVVRKGRLFPTIRSLEKLMYLSIEKCTSKWSSPIAHWGQILSQLSGYFPEKLGKYLSN